MDQHKAHQQAGTLTEFWHIVIPAYIDKFPEDNVAIEPDAHLPSKTNCGKISKRRADGQIKPLREVGFFANAMQVTL